jgi:CheY-like chemotaxis protein
MARALTVFQQTALDRIAAEESARARAEFLAVMSHEIRTPLNGVLGMTQALAATQLDPAQNRMVSVVLESGRTLLTLLNDILDFSKIEAGKLELERAPFDPRDLVDSAVSLFDERATAKGLLLRAELPSPGQLGWRLGDAQRLRQVVFNLVSNAIKFTEAGEVVVTLDAAGPDQLRLTVRDTGIGITPEGRQRLFNRFSQTDVSHARLYGGTGLGLAITRALAEAMQGRIEVESTPGSGSVFTVTLTAEACAAPPEADTASVPAPLLRAGAGAGDALHPAGAQSAADDETPLSVLVAEDNATNRLVIATLFSQIGIRPDFAEDGKLAFEAWQARAYDVVLMDMQMPVWDGLTAIRAIREAEAASGRVRTPIVTLTANAMVHQIAEQLAAGADTHAAKPIQMPQLLAAMDEAMQACAEAAGPAYSDASAA